MAVLFFQGIHDRTRLLPAANFQSFPWAPGESGVFVWPIVNIFFRESLVRHQEGKMFAKIQLEID